MGQPALQGMFAVKLPVSDLTQSRAWYEQVFGFIPEIEFPDDDGVVRGVAGHLPGVGCRARQAVTVPAIAQRVRA